jgi:AAA15 family ATPase/GTPase
MVVDQAKEKIMANHAFICEKEKAIIQANKAVTSLMIAYCDEKHREGNGKCYPENRDYYGTARLNAYALKRQIEDFLKVIDKEFS